MVPLARQRNFRPAFSKRKGLSPSPLGDAQVVAEDEAVVEQIVVGDAMRGVAGLLRVLQQDARLQPRPILLPDPDQFESRIPHFRASRLSYSRRIDSMSGAASDSVSLISVLHFGQVIVGSGIGLSIDSPVTMRGLAAPWASSPKYPADGKQGAKFDLLHE